MEFSLARNPIAADGAWGKATISNGMVTVRYQRSATARRSGVVFRVKWATALSGASWSAVGVTEVVESTIGDVENIAASFPVSTNTQLWLCLSVEGL
jgi:hypothetical protein